MQDPDVDYTIRLEFSNCPGRFKPGDVVPSGTTDGRGFVYTYAQGTAAVVATSIEVENNGEDCTVFVYVKHWPHVR